MSQRLDNTGRWWWSAAAGLLALLVATTVSADDVKLNKLSEKLADMRAEVDDLASTVENEKSEIDSRVQSIRRQRADLEMQIQREKSRLQQLEQDWEKQKAQMEKNRKQNKQLKPAFDAAASALRANIKTGPPFKRSERLNQVQELETQVEEGVLSPQKGISRMWQAVEDELRLSEENGIYQQVVTLDGNEVLADVARVGMVGLFFKTDDGRVGMAQRDGDIWSWKVASKEKRINRIRTLFDSFRKGIRSGYFTMPNAFQGIERRSGGKQ